MENQCEKAAKCRKSKQASKQASHPLGKFSIVWCSLVNDDNKREQDRR